MKLTIILTLVIIAAAFLMLCVRILLKNGGRFSSQHIGENKRMRDENITCVASQDRAAQQKSDKRLDVKQL